MLLHTDEFTYRLEPELSWVQRGGWTFRGQPDSQPPPWRCKSSPLVDLEHSAQCLQQCSWRPGHKGIFRKLATRFMIKWYHCALRYPHVLPSYRREERFCCWYSSPVDTCPVWTIDLTALNPVSQDGAAVVVWLIPGDQHAGGRYIVNLWLLRSLWRFCGWYRDMWALYRYYIDLLYSFPFLLS